MKLKQYQTDTLSVLRRFFEEARVAGPKGAYEAITREPDQAKRLGRYGGSYTPLAELPAVPYVCLRLPTGGGKTILGAHSIGIARDAWVEKDYPMVLWLVPSNTIRLQTAEGLCCTNPVRDSSRESSMVAGWHEQTDTPDLQDQELAIIQQGAEASWLADDLVRSRHDLGGRPDGEARPAARL